jgi:hypothetical protein
VVWACVLLTVTTAGRPHHCCVALAYIQEHRAEHAGSPGRTASVATLLTSLPSRQSNLEFARDLLHLNYGDIGAVEDRPNGRSLDLDLLNRFLERLALLEGELGPVMFQFEYMNRTKTPSGTEFLDRLDQPRKRRGFPAIDMHS